MHRKKQQAKLLILLFSFISLWHHIILIGHRTPLTPHPPHTRPRPHTTAQAAIKKGGTGKVAVGTGHQKQLFGDRMIMILLFSLRLALLLNI
jgi:hypothetical protein